VTSSATTAETAVVLTILKTTDAPSVSAGTNIDFTVTVSNNSSGTATGVVMSDPLPAGPAGSGVVWSIATAVPGCSISGAPGSQTLTCTTGTMAPGPSLSVHVTSATTATCATALTLGHGQRLERRQRECHRHHRGGEGGVAQIAHHEDGRRQPGVGGHGHWPHRHGGRRRRRRRHGHGHRRDAQ